MPKPKITIDNFTLIGKGATYWLENFDVDNVGGQNLLSSVWYNLKRIDTDDAYGTGFSNLTNIKAFSDWTDISGTEYVVAFTGDKIFLIDPATPSSSIGEIHEQASAGSGVNQVLASTYPDIFVTKDGHILYTSAHHVGIGWYGICKTGSGTTKIVDNDGRDFNTNYGVFNSAVGSTAAAQYVYNIDNQERYTITSVSTTNSADDTLNFAAGTSNDAGEEFIVFVDNGWDGTDNYEFNVSNTTDQHFKGQDVPSNWRRQISLLGDDYIILNGNYIATLNINLTTWAEQAKQLPYSTQAMSSAVNNGKILIGTKKSNKGTLLLWDGYTSGWNSILDTDSPVYAIQPYRDGWIALIGNSLFYTNGYDKTKLGDLPDHNFYSDAPEYHFNQLKIVDNRAFIVGNTINYKRGRHGIYIFNIDTKGWTFVPFIDKSGKSNIVDTNLTGLHSVSWGSSYGIYHSTADSINYITANATNTNKSKALFYIKLPEKMRLSQLELNISFKHSIIEQSLNDTTETLYISYGDGRKPFWRKIQASAASTTSSIINTNGDINPVTVGQEILVADGTNAPAGDVSWVTAISNAGTTSENLTISPVLSADITNTTDIIITDLKQADSKTITYDENLNFLQTLRYNLNDFYSDKLYLQVYLTGTTIYPIDIHSINIY